MSASGGPAFPAQEFIAGFDETPPVMASKFHHGMSLRDYFAAKAMQPMLSLAFTSADPGAIPDEYISTRAYAFADAMLKAR